MRRTGRMTPGQQRALDDLWPLYGVDHTAAVADLNDLFGRHASRVLEIGFGNGETLVAQAAASPDLDFLGIEVHKPGVGHCLLLASDAGISNLRIFQHDALEVLQQQLPDAALWRINLYFPDPWPKKRHHKRRILQPGFLALAARKLELHGSLQIATDWTGYAQHIDALIAASREFKLDRRIEHTGEHALDRPTTRFEKRGLTKGHLIRDWRLLRI